MNEEVVKYIEFDDLPPDMQEVAEVLGIEAARTLISECGGMRLQIPMPKSVKPAIKKYVTVHIKKLTVRQIARRLNFTERYVSSIVKNDN